MGDVPVNPIPDPPSSKRRAPDSWRWWSGIGFGLLLLAARLPDCVSPVRDVQGRITAQTMLDPLATGWTILYTLIAVGCILFGRDVVVVFGFLMIAVGIFVR